MAVSMNSDDQALVDSKIAAAFAAHHILASSNSVSIGIDSDCDEVAIGRYAVDDDTGKVSNATVRCNGTLILHGKVQAINPSTGAHNLSHGLVVLAGLFGGNVND